MATADWIVIGVVILFGFYGLSRGLVRGALSLAGFALGAYLGAQIAPAFLSEGSPYAPLVALGAAILGGVLLQTFAGILGGTLRAGMLTPVRARELIEDGAKRALSKLSAVAPWDPGRPSEIRAEYVNTTSPDALRHRGGVERVDDRTVVSRADTWWEAWKQFYF